MKFVARLFIPSLMCSLFFFLAAGSALAANSHDRTQFGHDITIGPGDEASEVTCFGCSVRVRGHVSGDVTTFGGTVLVQDQGEVSGDTTTFGGDARLDSGAKVDGDVTVFGGRLHRDADASIGGDVTNFGGGFWLPLIFALPLVIVGAFIALIVWVVRLLVRRTMPVAA